MKDFINDSKKIIDFFKMSKTEFLSKYHSCTKEEWDATFIQIMCFVDNYKSNFILTKEEVVQYLIGQGQENPNQWMINKFLCPKNYSRRFQCAEAVKNNYSISDFDRWQHLEDVIKHEISFRDYLKIDDVMSENKINVLEI